MRNRTQFALFLFYKMATFRQNPCCLDAERRNENTNQTPSGYAETLSLFHNR